MNFNRLTKFFFVTIVISLVFLSITASFAQPDARKEIKVPDIPGYITLKCDLHMHTVFSDGSVWPNIRVEEAWRDGLDVLAITEHVEYQIHKKELIPSYERPYEIAKPLADKLGLILIKGAEITRSMPPGHLNALFVKDIDALNTKEWQDAIKAANDQGAFVFWNHPGWEAQAPNGAIWYDEHTELFEKGYFKGIEIVNHHSYYPDVHQWALDKNLTMLGNSDSHYPLTMEYDYSNGAHRPINLVFVKERTEPAIKEALLDRRTVVYNENNLIGLEKFLKPIFENSIEILNPEISIKAKERFEIQIKNNSDICYELEANGDVAEISFPKKATLYPGATIRLSMRGKLEQIVGKQKVAVPYKVTNLLIAPGEGLPVELKIRIDFI